MDGNRLDNLAMSLADSGASRRSLLARLAAGGFAAILAALGIGGFIAEDAEARKKGRRKKAKSCAQRCKSKGRGRKKGGGKKGGRKKRGGRRKRQACLARCNQQPTGGGGGGGGTQTTPSFPITPDSEDIDITVNIPCTTPGEQGLCAAGQTCVAVGGLGQTVCLQECVNTVDCAAGTTCVLGVCLPLDVGGTCDSGDDCDTGFCANIDPVTQLGICDICDVVKVCGTQSDPVCCVADAQCVNNTCVLQTSP